MILHSTRFLLSRYGEEPDIGLPEFFEIVGGCKDLGLQGMWFTWVDRAMLVAAWRKVGFMGCSLDPTQIDRTHFIDKQMVNTFEEQSGPQSVEEV